MLRGIPADEGRRKHSVMSMLERCRSVENQPEAKHEA